MTNNALFLPYKREKKKFFILTSVNSCLLNTKSSMDVMADLVRLCTNSVLPGSASDERRNHIQLILLVYKEAM